MENLFYEAKLNHYTFFSVICENSKPIFLVEGHLHACLSLVFILCTYTIFDTALEIMVIPTCPGYNALSHDFNGVKHLWNLTKPFSVVKLCHIRIFNLYT